MLLLQFQAVSVGIVKAITVKHHLSPQSLGALHLQNRRGGRHANDRLHSQLLCRIGHTLGMVASRGGNHAALPLLLRQLADLVVGAPELEGPCMLHILRLQIDLAARQLRKEIAMHELRMTGNSLQLLSRFIHIGNSGACHHFCLTFTGNFLVLFLFSH